MWFTSTEGKGSEFHFTIPHKPVKPHPLEELTMIPESRKHIPQKKVILVAEDDHLNFSLINNFLSKRNVKIVRAENGREAVDLCNSNKIDLVLMDIRMPVMDGYTATRIIKESYPSLIIIAQTAYTNDRDTAISNGCDDFIAKPFTKNQLLAIVDGYL
jgi:two-component system sensor histidine kinase EvgS